MDTYSLSSSLSVCLASDSYFAVIHLCLLTAITMTAGVGDRPEVMETMDSRLAMTNKRTVTSKFILFSNYTCMEGGDRGREGNTEMWCLTSKLKSLPC